MIRVSHILDTQVALVHLPLSSGYYLPTIPQRWRERCRLLALCHGGDCQEEPGMYCPIYNIVGLSLTALGIPPRFLLPRHSLFPILASWEALRGCCGGVRA